MNLCKRLEGCARVESAFASPLLHGLGETSPAERLPRILLTHLSVSMSEGATGAKTAPVSPRGASEPPARQDHSAGRADAPAAGASAATPVPRKRGRDSDDEDEAGGAGGARGSKGGLPGGAGVDGAAGSAAATVDTADVADAPELKGQYVDQQWGFEHVEELVFSRRKLAK